MPQLGEKTDRAKLGLGVPGFHGVWVVKTIEQSAECLDGGGWTRLPGNAEPQLGANEKKHAKLGLGAPSQSTTEVKP